LALAVWSPIAGEEQAEPQVKKIRGKEAAQVLDRFFPVKKKG
jgi:hypothetical protein